MKKMIIKQITKSKKCYLCNGKGCKNCSYTGKYNNSGYLLITKDNKEQTIAFNIDQAGK